MIGGEIGGFSAVWLPKCQHQVTLYETADYLGDNAKAVDLTLDGVIYLSERFNKLSFDRQLMMILNPPLALMIQGEIVSFDQEHPIFDQAVIDAKSRLNSTQGCNRAWFSGTSHLYPLVFHCADQSRAFSR